MQQPGINQRAFPPQVRGTSLPTIPRHSAAWAGPLLPTFCRRRALGRLAPPLALAAFFVLLRVALLLALRGAHVMGKTRGRWRAGVGRLAKTKMAAAPGLVAAAAAGRRAGRAH